MSPVGTTSTAVNGNGADDSFLDEVGLIMAPYLQANKTVELDICYSRNDSPV
jgi:hypothetical protein